MSHNAFIRLASPSSGALQITSVSPAIFHRSYFSRCLECDFCADACCNFGCDVTAAEEARIMDRRVEIEAATNIPAADWFSGAPVADAEYPSGSYRRTVRRNGKCIFFAAEPRGCALHRFALRRGLDPHDIKPMVCFLFPLTWDAGRLYICSYLDELRCKNCGDNMYLAQRHELLRYLGEVAVYELDVLAESSAPGKSTDGHGNSTTG